MTVKELFELYQDEHSKFENVKNKFSQKRDLHAFIMLDRLFNDDRRRIVTSASHDEITLFPTLEQIESLTSNKVLELVRCGVMYDEEEEYLGMFV